MNDDVSIITPIYNVSVDYLKECSRSVFASTYAQWEWIIVDDGSTDPEIPAFLDSLEDSRVRILHSPHKGVSYARNLALSSLRTEYFLFLDADDVIAPTFIERGVSLLQHYEADIVVGQTQDFSSAFSITNNSEVPFVAALDMFDETSRLKQYIQGGVPPKELPIDGFKWFPTMVASKITRTSLLNNLKFDERLTIAEDYLFFTSLFMRSHRVVFSEEVWYGYRQHAASTMSGTSLSAILGQMNSWAIVYQTSEKLGWSKENIGIRYLIAIINRVLYHPQQLSVNELHTYLQQVEKCGLFGVSRHCELSRWQFSLKRKILISLIQHEWNWLGALMLRLGSLMRLRKSNLK